MNAIRQLIAKGAPNFLSAMYRLEPNTVKSLAGVE